MKMSEITSKDSSHREVTNNEMMLFNILEELYELNHKEWKRRIIAVLTKNEEASFRQIKEKFLEIPDMLVYRCLHEMRAEGMIYRDNESGYVRYSFTPEGKALVPILEEVQK